MGTQIKSYEELNKELENAKHSLLVLNDDIKRLAGHTIRDQRNSKLRVKEEVKKNSERPVQKNNEISKFKRSNNDAKLVFNRLYSSISRTEGEGSRPRLNSRVIRELPTRQEVVEAQGNDSESRARNRRIFGSLLGTLHKFCQEESQLKHKEDKKAQVEKKVEDQKRKEREEMRKERENLYESRKRKQLEIKKLELKMVCVNDFEVWKSSMNSLRKFIKTKTAPHIYFRPRHLSKRTEKLIAENEAMVQSEIKKKHNELQQKLIEAENILGYELDDEKNDRLSLNLSESNNDAEYSQNKQKPKSRVESSRRSPVPVDEDIVKGYADSKENNSKSTTGPTLNSSVIVVQNVCNNIKKE